MSRRGRSRYWIDGYNVILSAGIGDGASLEERRAELAARVAGSCPRAWIVFDSKGREGVSRRGHSFSGVEVAFAPSGLSADDVIADRVRNSRQLEGVVVVTDDRELAGRCRSLGVSILGVRRFVQDVLQPAPEANSERHDQPLSRAQINEWLRYFGVEPGPSGDDPPTRK